MHQTYNPFPRLTKQQGEELLADWRRQYTQRYAGNVYHYTTIAALAGILDSRAIYCTDYRQLNDMTELKLGVGTLEAAISARGENFGISADDVGAALDRLAIFRNGGLFHISMFAASFSMFGNDLTQWRAYAPTDGVSIGFNEQLLRQTAQDQNFVCGPIRYRGGPLFEEWLNEQLLGMKEGLLRKTAIAGFERWACEVASLLKNPDFRSEQEWRCAFVLRDNTTQPRPPIDYRVTCTRVVRYVSLDLSDTNLSELISEVIVGPNTPDETVWFVGDMLRQAGVAAQVTGPAHAVR